MIILYWRILYGMYGLGVSIFFVHFLSLLSSPYHGKSSNCVLIPICGPYKFPPLQGND